MVAALLRVVWVTAGLVESKGSLLAGLWLTSPAGWLLRTGISSGTLRSVIEYGLPFLLLNITWRYLHHKIWKEANYNISFFISTVCKNCNFKSLIMSVFYTYMPVVSAAHSLLGTGIFTMPIFVASTRLTSHYYPTVLLAERWATV